MVHKKKKVFAPKVEQSNTQSMNPVASGYNSAMERSLRRGRLIVRNLPFFQLSESKIQDFFSEYGNIVDVKLLRRKDNSFVGCGFVEFDKRQSAAKAIYHTNGKMMSGRHIVVDWALPKQTFIEKIKQVGNLVTRDGGGDDTTETLEYSIDTKPDFIVDDDNSQCDSTEEGDANNDETLEENEQDDEVKDYDFDDDEDDEIAEKKEEPKKNLSNDVGEGKTVFIKNLPFAATNEDVKTTFEVYGPLVYALVCMDKLTEHSKGSAFVKFKEKESADKCIQAGNNIYLMDQPLQVTRAVSKDELEEEKKKKKTKVKDSRNLYLVREGAVMAGSPAAVTVSAADMAKRLQIEQWKTQILRNLNMFVSRTRLVVHNLPATYDDDQLRNLFVQNSPPSAVVKEARIMRDRKKFDGQGDAVSKEVGFVSFTNHEHALCALRRINNNPSIFTVSHRPIVSFSIENREILNMKQKRLEKSRAKVGNSKVPLGKDAEKLNKKQRRFLRRKAKFIAERKAKKLKLEQGGEGDTKDASVEGVKRKRNGKDTSMEGKKQKKNNKETSTEGKKRKKSDKDTSTEGKKPKVRQINERVAGIIKAKNDAAIKAAKKIKGNGKVKINLIVNAKVFNQRRKERSKAKLEKANESLPGSSTSKSDASDKPSKKVLEKLDEDFSGVSAEPGKTLKMRSKFKLRKQVEIHKEKLKTQKKLKKSKKVLAQKKKIAKEREPGVKKKKSVNLLKDDKFEKLVSKYKSKIGSAESFKKWYDTSK